MKSLHNLGFEKRAGILSSALKSTAGVLTSSYERGGVRKAFSETLGHLSSFKNPTHLMDVSKLNRASVTAEHLRNVNFKSSPLGVLNNPTQGHSGFSKFTGGILRGIGNQASNIKDIVYGGANFTSKNPVGRAFEVLGKELDAARYYNRPSSIKGQDLIYKRSLPGRILNPIISTGVGIGATQGLMTRNPDGSSASTGKKLFVGAKESLKWGIGGPIMLAKGLAYDIPKATYNIIKQRKTIE